MDDQPVEPANATPPRPYSVRWVPLRRGEVFRPTARELRDVAVGALFLLAAVVLPRM
jgi:hypothetical protein